MPPHRPKKRLPAILRVTNSADGSTTISVRDASKLRASMGDDLLAAFGCCFAAANRSAALVQLQKLNKGTDFEPAKIRNSFTLFFTSIGVAHESVAAIQHLSKQLRLANCPGTLASENYREVLACARRWRKHFAKHLRNKWAFHFDVDSHLAGLEAWAQPNEIPLHFLDSDMREVYFPFADDLMIMGTVRRIPGEVAEQSVDAFARELWSDQNTFAVRIFNAFAEALTELAGGAAKRAAADEVRRR